MKNNLQIKNKWRLIKPWLGVVALGGAGVLPCPDCGAPMIFHFWPFALFLALRNLRKSKRSNQIDQANEELHENTM
jgi:hypothetical protein